MNSLEQRARLSLQCRFLSFQAVYLSSTFRRTSYPLYFIFTYCLFLCYTVSHSTNQDTKGGDYYKKEKVNRRSSVGKCFEY